MSRVLMCPPDYYGIEYEINAWMSRSRQSDRARAIEQWQTLRQLIEKTGAQVELLEPVPGLPDYVFTANAALVYGRRAIMARFRPQQRQPETPHAAAWFRDHGYSVETIPEPYCFEGAGDALFCGETLFAGYRIRSDARGQQELGRMLDCEVLPLELVDPYFYHLDTCFCPLGPGQALYYPPAFDDYGRRVLQARIDDLIAVCDDEARQFACNAVALGHTVLTHAGCTHLHEALRQRGFTPIGIPLDEFIKAGGSAKCLTLMLD
ncbi:MAG: amidinotransferase [Planctomycetaceae bacterium]|nr:amidinotransferase [Planctomycetaceae bacterium]